MKDLLCSRGSDGFIPLQRITEQGRSGIAILACDICVYMTGHSITIETAVRTGVIPADIAALYAATGFALSAILFFDC